MKPSAFGQANKVGPCPSRLRIRIKPQAHTRPNSRTFPLNLCCVYAFLWRFCAIVAQKHQQNFNKCLAVCIIVAESACHCDEFDKSKFCNLPKNHLLECSRIEIFIPKYYTAFYKKAHNKHTVSYFSRRKRKCLPIGLYSQKRL